MAYDTTYRDALGPKEVKCKALMEQAKEALEQPFMDIELFGKELEEIMGNNKLEEKAL